MFNFFSDAEVADVSSATTSLEAATPEFKLLFGSWYALAAPD